jgi:hypothetical protein
MATVKPEAYLDGTAVALDVVGVAPVVVFVVVLFLALPHAPASSTSTAAPASRRRDRSLLTKHLRN